MDRYQTMAHQLTNEKLNALLLHLGFQRGDAAKTNICYWRHPDSGCTLLVPENKMQQPPRPADLVGIKAQLDLQGHLDEEAFDLFVAQGTLPAGFPQQR